MTKQPLVVFEDVTKRYGTFTAVSPINLEIYKGEFLAIMGSSGCGKTTTLRMLAGLETPSDGEIRLAGKRINDLPTWQRDTPMVWQSLALFPFLTVRENIEFSLRMRGVERAERSARVDKWLDRMQITEFAERNVAHLSGGQRQRVALARSLVTEPEILLMDEPLSALDAHLKVRMQTVLSNLQRELGITFVYVTHSQSEAFSMADRVVIMSAGRVQQIGRPQEVYDRPASLFVATFIGAPPMNLFDVADVPVPAGTFPSSVATVGVRPEDIMLRTDVEGKGIRLDCSVSLVETLGADSVLHLRTVSQDGRPGLPVIARMGGNAREWEGRTMPIWLPPSRLHFFDQSGLRAEIPLSR